MNRYYMDAKNYGITITVNGSFPRECKIDAYDLCTIFSNILSNALEAARQAPEKRIALSCRYTSSNIIIIIKNTFMNVGQFDRKQIQTSKQDLDYHGFGLENIRECVEQHNGLMDIEIKNEECIRRHYTDINIELDVYDNPLVYLTNETKYDISFIDIEMNELDGFDTIKRARTYHPEGIFVILTTHTEMSRKGYMVNAFRYLDKKFLPDEMEEALTSAEILLRKNEKIRLNIVGEGERDFVLKNIIYISTEKRSLLIHTTSGMKRCNNTLADIEKLLHGTWFYRCHNSFIVNLDEITSFKAPIIYLSNGDDIDISKRKLWEFRRLYLKRQYECANG